MTRDECLDLVVDFVDSMREFPMDAPKRQGWANVLMEFLGHCDVQLVRDAVGKLLGEMSADKITPDRVLARARGREGESEQLRLEHFPEVLPREKSPGLKSLQQVLDRLAERGVMPVGPSRHRVRP